MKKDPAAHIRTIHAFVGILLLLCGYGLYLSFRQPGETVWHAWPLSQFLMQLIPRVVVHAPWMDWMPSFIYVLAFSLLTAGIFGARSNRIAIPVFWTMVVSLFEVGQYFHLSVGALVPAAWATVLPIQYCENYFLIGTFDPLDLVAGFGGMAAALLVLAPGRGNAVLHALKRPLVMQYLRKAGSLAVLLIGVSCLLATSVQEDYHTHHCTYFPVYLSYEDLRTPVTASAPEAISESGKITVYGSLILFNQPNKGIHFIDNTNPAAPVNMLFLPIPGNLDMAVKDDILYADSFVDLVAIDISDQNNIHEVNRVQDVFPYDPYQTLTVPLADACPYDRTLGVIVRYEKPLDPLQGGN
jgi:hypothetical protein